MADDFLFKIFPYIAFSLAITVGVYRYGSDRFSYSSLSSQFLENRVLFFGSVPWHYGIVIILLAHLFTGLFRPLAASFLMNSLRLFVLEFIGMALGLLALSGMVLLIIRRITNPKVRTVTSTMDWILLLVLIVQVGAGVFIALSYRWGSLWYLETAVPWFWSIAGLHPTFNALIPLPWVVKLHMFTGFVIIALFPFTRLVHIFTAPISYLWRPLQVVIWNRRQRPAVGQPPGGVAPISEAVESRRRFFVIATGALSVLVASAVGIPWISTILGPIFRRRKPSWAKVADLKSIPPGQPVSLTFASLNVDAYVRELTPHSVWVVKHSDTDVTVYSSICPHLGCHYNWNPQANRFECPCHGSVYTIEGKVIGGPAPRPLDRLPAKLEGGDLYAEWQEFRIGIPEKIPV